MLLTYTQPPLHADFLAGEQRDLAMNPTVENETSQRKEFEAFRPVVNGKRPRETTEASSRAQMLAP